MKLEFSGQIFKKNKKLKYQIYRPVRAELFHAGGRADGRTNRHGEAVLRTRLKASELLV